MPAAIGYINGHHGHSGNYGNYGNYGYAFNQGISDKDQMFAQTIDAGERTRDVLGAIADSITATEKTGAASVLATEKIGAAAELTAEKIGSAGVLATHNASAQQLLAMHNLAHANTLAVQLGFKDAAMQLAEQGEAGIDRRAAAIRPFQHHRAGAAIALRAALLGAGQLQFVTQDIEQGLRSLAEKVDFVAVDHGVDMMFLVHQFFPAR
jgi:hypothetical protein